ncbi:hypothetical protein D9M71_300470 [compost metagenome]
MPVQLQRVVHQVEQWGVVHRRLVAHVLFARVGGLWFSVFVRIELGIGVQGRKVFGPLGSFVLFDRVQRWCGRCFFQVDIAERKRRLGSLVGLRLELQRALVDDRW